MDGGRAMIEINSNTAVIIYLGLCLFSILGIWGWQHFYRRNRKIILAQKKLTVCEYCHFAYLDNGIKNVTKCPQCQSFNQ